MISGSSDVAGHFAGYIPLFGGTLKNVIGGTGHAFGDLSERLGSGIGNMLSGGTPSQTGGWRRKRSALSAAQEAKEYLDKFDVHLSPDASEVAKGFQQLANEIKEKTIKAVQEKEEKKSRDTPLKR
ncbi:hypothetical protein COOONC_07702 [Cooperia oncophora]